MARMLLLRPKKASSPALLRKESGWPRFTEVRSGRRRVFFPAGDRERTCRFRWTRAIDTAHEQDPASSERGCPHRSTSAIVVRFASPFTASREVM